jgi:hypothetical protein
MNIIWSHFLRNKVLGVGVMGNFLVVDSKNFRVLG